MTPCNGLAGGLVRGGGGLLRSRRGARVLLGWAGGFVAVGSQGLVLID